MRIRRSTDRLYHFKLTTDLRGWIAPIDIFFRWYPIIYWRFFPRAWGAPAPSGFIAASDWTGREREFLNWFWPTSIRRADPAVIIADEARMSEPVSNWLVR